MAKLRLVTNDGKVLGLRLDGIDVLTNDDGSVVFYANRLVVKNMLTGEVRDYTQKADENPEQ